MTTFTNCHDADGVMVSFSIAMSSDIKFDDVAEESGIASGRCALTERGRRIVLSNPMILAMIRQALGYGAGSLMGPHKLSRNVEMVPNSPDPA